MIPFTPQPRISEADRAYDLPYKYRQPSTASSFPFTGLQYARLLLLRGKVLAYETDNLISFRQRQEVPD